MLALLLSLSLACGEKEPPNDSADSAQDSQAPDDTGAADDSAADDSAVDDTSADDSTADDSASDDSATGDSGDSGDTGEEPAAIEDIRAAVQAWFEADHSAGPRTTLAGLPEGALLDPREGQPDRAGVPAQVLAGFDYAVRIEAAGEGATRMDLGVIDTYAVYTVTTVGADGDAYVEVRTPDERLVTGARFHGSEAPVWDSFDGRVRLAQRFTTLDGLTWEEGYSEAAERAAAGQPPQGWSGDVQVSSGSLPWAGSLMGPVDFDGLALTDAQRDVAVAAFDFLWDAHLKYTVSTGTAVTLGSRNQGLLTVGEFTRSTTGETFMVADWRDIDDGSFVLYFDLGAEDPQLRVVQYDN
ncbi:MAG: hypothetical protein H6741_18260 [Alphaproteobacteria bacterium]|nr:hypothetical protein [Alphaproteobacteria bacterium]